METATTNKKSTSGCGGKGIMFPSKIESKEEQLIIVITLVQLVRHILCDSNDKLGQLAWEVLLKGFSTLDNPVMLDYGHPSV